MEYDSALSLLSSKFTENYPPATYPERMHKNAFMFTGTARSKKSKSGLDYSKIAIIKNVDYFDLTTTDIIDKDEYTEMLKYLPTIVGEANDYVNTYIRHINGAATMHPKAFLRKYQYSTLPYFHDILGI